MGKLEFDSSCILGIPVPATQTAEVFFVAVRGGRQEFEDNPFLYAKVVAGYGSDLISIDGGAVIK